MVLLPDADAVVCAFRLPSRPPSGQFLPIPWPVASSTSTSSSRARRQPGNLTKLLCCSQTRSLNGFIITTRSSKEFPKRAGFLPASPSPSSLVDYTSPQNGVYLYAHLSVSVCWSNANCSNNWPIMPQNTETSGTASARLGQWTRKLQ